MAQIRYLDDAGHIQTVDLGSGRFTVGRVASCNIMFVDDMVSREHLEIQPADDGHYTIRDLGSRNKTFVNGEAVTETILTGGDVVRVGDHVLEFLNDYAHPNKIGLDFLTPDREDPPDCDWIKIKTPLTLTTDQLGRLSGIVCNQGVLVRPEGVVDTALSYLIVDLQAERGFVAIRGEGKRDLKVICQRGLSRAPGTGLMPASESFVFSAVLQQVAGRYPKSGAPISEKVGYASTAMVAPMVYRGDVIGLVYLDRTAAKRSFTASALQQFAAAASQMAALTASATHRLSRSAEREGRAHMSYIRRMHAELTPQLAEVSGFEIASRLLPGHGRCGDLCDVFEVSEEGLCAVVVDSGGHGMLGLGQAASIRMALGTALRLPGAIEDMGAAFNAMNEALSALPGRRFVACCAVYLDIGASRLNYINAGAAMPLLLPAATRLQILDYPSLVLGTDTKYTYETTTVDLPTAFRLILHTDGLVESGNASGEGFGDDRLRDVLLDAASFTNPEQMVRIVTEALGKHTAGHNSDDDALVLVIGR